MKTIMLIIHLLNGDVAKIPIVLAIGEWCSDKIDEHTKFIENPNYYEGSGKVWTHRYYKDKIVLTPYVKNYQTIFINGQKKKYISIVVIMLGNHLNFLRVQKYTNI